MILLDKYNSVSIGVVATCLLVATLLVMPKFSSAQFAPIAISECELNGFSLGGTADQMRKVLGEPDSISFAKSPKNEYPRREYQYDGLRIAFSTHGLSAMSYFVSSEKYRLRSGAGVGSTRQEIESSLGPTSEYPAGDFDYLTYRVIEADGGPVPVLLTFKLDHEIAIEFSVVTR